MLVIGLTGGVGTGKSAVATMLVKLGAREIDADKIVHRALGKKGRCVRPVVREFGKQMMLKGGIDRSKLASIVFGDHKKLRILECITHPVVKKITVEEIKKLRRSKGVKVVVLNVPLLFESGMNKLCDFIVVVKARRGFQLSRTCKRLRITKTEVIHRIKSQMLLSKKIQKADFIIDNNGSLMETKKQVVKLWQKLYPKREN